MNVFHLTGHLTHDPELKFTTNGKPKAILRLAQNSHRKNPTTGAEYPANFFYITAWAGAENHAQYLQKGQYVEITGRLDDERWESDGEKHYRIGLIATEVTYGRKPSGSKTDNTEHQDGPGPGWDADEEPF